MRKITKRDMRLLEKGALRPKGGWDSGARLDISLQWDCETYIINATEVTNDLNKYLAKWPGRKKFKVFSNVKADITYRR